MKLRVTYWLNKIVQTRQDVDQQLQKDLVSVLIGNSTNYIGG
ncbi:hypothetical protein [Terrilactibacillus tamarindi]|nr:hypothetical protein [Terrilactibacillus tamarindi]